MPEAAAIANVAIDIAMPARALRALVSVVAGSTAVPAVSGASASAPSVSVCVLMPEERLGERDSRGEV